MVSFFLESEFLKQEQRQKCDSEREMFSSFWFFFFESDCFHMLIARRTSDRMIWLQQIRNND